MQVVALAVLPVVLAAVFVAAGSLKLQRPQAVLVAFENFSVPRPLRNKGSAIALSLGEVVLGALLVTAHGWLFTAAAVTATVATAGFVFVTGRALAEGKDFDCGCFGAAQTPISRALVLRNAVLLTGAVASMVLGLNGFGGVIAAAGTFTSSDAAWAGTSVFLVALTAAFIYSTSGSTMERPRPQEGFFAGTLMPDLYFVTADGDPVRLLDMLVGQAQLIVMVRPSCRTCAAFLEDTSPLQETLAQELKLILVVSGDQEAFTNEHSALAPVSLFAGWPLTNYLRLSAYPSAVLVGSDGGILAEPVAGATAILRLAERATGLQKPKP